MAVEGLDGCDVKRLYLDPSLVPFGDKFVDGAVIELSDLL